MIDASSRPRVEQRLEQVYVETPGILLQTDNRFGIRKLPVHILQIEAILSRSQLAQDFLVLVEHLGCQGAPDRQLAIMSGPRGDSSRWVCSLAFCSGVTKWLSLSAVYFLDILRR